jgi:hypothetical protein
MKTQKQNQKAKSAIFTLTTITKKTDRRKLRSRLADSTQDWIWHYAC